MATVLAPRFLTDYERGRRDSALFTEVRNLGYAWAGMLQSDGTEAFITDKVTRRYLDGLVAGGCLVVMPRDVAA